METKVTFDCSSTFSKEMIKTFKNISRSQVLNLQKNTCVPLKLLKKCHIGFDATEPEGIVSMMKYGIGTSHYGPIKNYSLVQYDSSEKVLRNYAPLNGLGKDKITEHILNSNLFDRMKRFVIEWKLSRVKDLRLCEDAMTKLSMDDESCSINDDSSLNDQIEEIHASRCSNGHVLC